MKVIKKFLILLVTSCHLITYAQTTENKIMSLLGLAYPPTISEAHSNIKQNNIDKALVSYSQATDYAQFQRNAGKGVDGDLLAEYAYALALHHDFEAALMNIDRARMLGTKYGDFYAAQVLTVMGYKEAALQLMKKAKVPEWIKDDYQRLTEKYATTASIIRDEPGETLKRANKLAANKQTIQAIALFEELAVLYPKAYIVFVDHSTVWESLGYYGYASQLLQKGIKLMPDEQAENESRQVFTNHLNKVDAMKAKYENAPWLKRVLGMNPPKMMTYIGMSAAQDMFSLNGRLGIYTSNRFSASLNLGMSYMSKQMSGNIGLSAYKTWGIFVVGLGVNDQITENTNTFSLAPSAGLSFLNKNQTSSLDIMFNGYVPFSSDQKFSYSISVGKTIYFDLNKILK